MLSKWLISFGELLRLSWFAEEPGCGEKENHSGAGQDGGKMRLPDGKTWYEKDKVFERLEACRHAQRHRGVAECSREAAWHRHIKNQNRY